MTEFPYILFNKTPEQLRHLGARGGKAYGRNQRARRALAATPPQTVPSAAVPRKTAAEANHSLDTQFPWLRGAEKVTPRIRFDPLAGAGAGSAPKPCAR
jgi:hypothetical protein